MKMFIKPIIFQWTRGNINKNFKKHNVTNAECEEVFFDSKKKIFKDVLHSGNELRHILLGKTKTQRLLFTVFTIRNNQIRIISSRGINSKEIKLYEKRNQIKKI